MAYIEVSCLQCGCKRFIRDCDNADRKDLRSCPNCHTAISDSLWTEYIIPAFNMAILCDKKLRDMPPEEGCRQFQVAFHNGNTWITAHMSNGRRKDMTLAEAQNAINEPRRNTKIMAFSAFDSTLEKKLNRDLDRKAEQHRRAINKTMGIDDSDI